MDIKEVIEKSIAVKSQMLRDEALLNKVVQVAGIAADIIAAKGRILLCGNGGSAADAQHIAAELSGRFLLNREPYDAEALHVNTSYLTAVANDYHFNDVYARLLQAKGRKDDMLIAISTSGNSENIIKAAETARQLGMVTVGLTGIEGGKLKHICSHMIQVPSMETPRIQESHILIGHIFCELIEKQLSTD